MGRLMLVGLLAFAVALTGTAYAEVQNIKVSGDIDLKAIAHKNYDLKLKQKNQPKSNADESGGGGAADGVTNDDDESFYLSTVHLQVSADLTDNVSATVKLLNQRKWDSHTAAFENINLDNAYVVLKEFLYSPLTVIAGRQNLKYGNGFIVGEGLLADPEAVFGGANIGREYSAYNAFDAIRLILDYSPVTVEGLIAKVAETNVTDNDTDLYGIIVNYQHDQWNANVMPYWFYKDDHGASLVVSDSRLSDTAARTYDVNRVHTVGALVTASPIENLWLSLEGAGQFGEIFDRSSELDQRKREGWGAHLDARYNWAKAPWTPTTGVGWVFYSGEDSSRQNGNLPNESAIATTNGDDEFSAWDAVYRGSFQTYIQDFFAGNDGGGLYTTFDNNDTSAGTNRHLFYGDLTLKPLEDLTVWGRYTHVRFDNAPRIGRDEHAGDEIDAKVAYDYTEDVQLGVFGGWFFPGDYYGEPDSTRAGQDLAWTVGGSASVKF
ncbi:MAG: hypothetical protein HYZ90_06045 [Candidatus Omnitrophica bacterium]|nr:hypothetical protein [Candidatus Omnitrophota bacterium]